MTEIVSLNGPPPGFVAHAAWTDARTALLKLLSGGPTTLALLGEAGTGKTWLLRALARELEGSGCRVTLLRQGDMPFHLEPGDALLIDEAARMDDGALASLLGQRRGVVIIASLPSFAARLQRWAPPPCMITLAPLAPDEIAGFVEAWIPHASEAAVPLTEAALARLAVHSNGAPRLITQLLNAAFTMSAQYARPEVDGPDIDEAAEFRLGKDARELEEELALPAVAEQAFGVDAFWGRAKRPRRHRLTAFSALTASALTGAVAAALIGTWLGPAKSNWAAVHSPHRVLAGPIMAAELTPAVLATAAPAPSAVIAPVEAADAAEPVLAESGGPRLAAGVAPEPADEPVLEASAVPDLEPVERSVALERVTIGSGGTQDSDFRAGQGGPGLILVARRGDTLRALYANVYQGLQPPAYGDVEAANPRPFRPGGLVVFPAPPTGWPRP